MALPNGRGRSSRSAILLTGFVIVEGASIGLPYIPSVIAMILAALRRG